VGSSVSDASVVSSLVGPLQSNPAEGVFLAPRTSHSPPIYKFDEDGIDVVTLDRVDLQRSGEPQWKAATTETEVPHHRTSGNKDIFCNRELEMRKIRAVGFDMDFTLAQYNVAFDLLGYRGAQEKLVYKYGYPKEILAFQYNPALFRRGVVIDKARGNFLKVDRHKYVKTVFHGTRMLNSEQKRTLYLEYFDRMPSFSEKHYVAIDTLFQLVDACLFAQLVDLKDTRPDLSFPPYSQMFDEVHHCVDMCHRDGTIKETVAQDPARYVFPDLNIVPMIQRYRASGKKVFLLTNSHWDYTHVAMNFIVGNNYEEERGLDWLELFDIVIVGSGKPNFLNDPNLQLFRVNTTDGSLANADLTIVDGDEDSIQRFLQKGHVFQGGNWKHLHKLLRVESRGSEILYVGDHMYSDILQGKRNLGWRTCQIVPELAYEVKILQQEKDLAGTIQRMRNEMQDIDVVLDDLKMQLVSLRTTRMRTPRPPHTHALAQGSDEHLDLDLDADPRMPHVVAHADHTHTHHQVNNYHGHDAPADGDADESPLLHLRHEHEDENLARAEQILVEQIHRWEAEQQDHKLKLKEMNWLYHSRFHPIWGQLFKAGYQDSRFAKQVQDYSCIYTSRVSNLGLVSPERGFRTVRETMPHDATLDMDEM